MAFAYGVYGIFSKELKGSSFYVARSVEAVYCIP